MAINLVDWRVPRQQQLITQWLALNATAIVIALWLWPYLHPGRNTPRTTTTATTATTTMQHAELPMPTHATPTVQEATWHWATDMAQLLQAWPTGHRLNTLKWQREGVRLSGQCQHQCDIAHLLHFCQQSHSQLQHIQWHHATYQFDLYHAHSLPLP